MNKKLMSYLVDPNTKESLSIRSGGGDEFEEILDGELVSSSGKAYSIVNGIPRFVESADASQAQTADSFGYKWNARRNTFDSEAAHDAHHKWLVKKYGFSDRQSMRQHFSSQKKVLDAGCGNGLSASTWLFNDDFEKVQCEYVGVDISSSIDVAAQRLGSFPDTFFIQADLMKLPFGDDSFDIIFSEGVLHHTPSTEMALKSLVQYLQRGGEMMFYVYKEKGPIREFTDDHIRLLLSSMSPEEAWEALKPLTMLGQALAELQVEVNVPEDIPFLGIQAGRVDVQRLLYWNFAKMFWNRDLDFEDNHHVNFDWYHPKYAHRQTEEEVRRWCDEAGLSVAYFRVEESGFTVRAIKR